jgi:BioD-like phosphotransacetylase family protein
MNCIYVTSVEHYSGKTAVCLALGKRFQSEGKKVGYLKPLSLQYWRIEGRAVDQDAAFVKEALKLEAPAWELSPVVVTPELLREQLADEEVGDLIERVKTAADSAGLDKDVLLVEGGGNLREGYVVGLSSPEVVQALGCRSLAVLKYRDDVRLMDDALAAQALLGQSMMGVLINRAPARAGTFIQERAVPYLEAHGIPVFGVLPETSSLAALIVQEIVDVLDAEVLTKKARLDSLVENLTIGAMTPDEATRHFRRQTRQAVITGGDRVDIQLVALETSTACLILTGHLMPNALVIKQAEEFGIPILMVKRNTLETVEAIERVFGKTRLGQPAKLRKFQGLMDEHVDFARLSQALWS